MFASTYVPPDEIRLVFSKALSQMYKSEVPQYGVLMDLVADVNAATLRSDPELRDRLALAHDGARISDERHGAIRLGTASELVTVARMFKLMGLYAVGYYDLAAAGVPVHSTAFRPISDEALTFNPFRVFTSLLRLELVADAALRDEAREILARRNIFSPVALELLTIAESQQGLTESQVSDFIPALVDTFRWHGQATVDRPAYDRLSKAHRLLADVVCFRGPHVNHLTPRILDIDAAQVEMTMRGIDAKATIEGPPPRLCPILLRQTSFKALEEDIEFPSNGVGEHVVGAHAARFGEIEQRGVALTRTGRALYDRLLALARESDPSLDYSARLRDAFVAFPDDFAALREQGLAFFRYVLVSPAGANSAVSNLPIGQLIEVGIVRAEPITYQDFLPVSAAGIFQSNLGGSTENSFAASGSRDAFERALGGPVIDEMSLYEAQERRSIEEVRRVLKGEVQ